MACCQSSFKERLSSRPLLKTVATILAAGIFTPDSLPDETPAHHSPRARLRPGAPRQSAAAVAYWCLAEPGRQYLLYARGVKEPVRLQLDAADGSFTASQFDPRTGGQKHIGEITGGKIFEFQPPDEQDWMVVLRR